MIGRKIDLKYLIKELQNNKIINIRTTEFYQGRTTRWALGWSFSKDGLEEFIVIYSLFYYKYIFFYFIEKKNFTKIFSIKKKYNNFINK